MDKAPDFGSGDCRFESCHGRYFFLAKWIAIVDFTCNISCISFSFSALVSTGLSTINFHSTHPNMFANFPNVFVHVVQIKNLRILWSVCNSLLNLDRTKECGNRTLERQSLFCLLSSPPPSTLHCLQGSQWITEERGTTTTAGSKIRKPGGCWHGF